MTLQARFIDVVERSQDLQTRGRLAVTATGLVLTALVGLLDYETGRDFSVAVFYLVPILVVTLLAGSWPGVVVAFASATAWLIADINTSQYRSSAAPYWNVTVRLLIFLVDVFLVGALRSALARARASDQRSRQFLADAAHQIRTPLAGLRLSSEALLRDRGQGDRERLLANVATESNRAGRLVNNLLRMTRLDEGERVTNQSCDAVDLARAEIERFEALAPQLRFRLVTDERPAIVSCDRASLAELLSNLLENAVRHACSEVTVRLVTRAGSTEVHIGDDGPGIPHGAHERIFERFVSLDGRGGSGLGLAIARSIAEAHAGSVTHRDGCFVVALPGPPPH